MLAERDAFHYKDGFIQLPETPGLGLNIDEDKVEELGRIGHDWKNPIWHGYDGTPIEW